MNSSSFRRESGRSRFQHPSKHVAERLGWPAAKALDVAGQNVEPIRTQVAALQLAVGPRENIVEDALRASGGRVFGQSGAAERLGIPRSTLESKIRTLKIDKSRFRPRTAKH